MSNKSSGMAWLVFGLVLVCLMPSNQSLWIDEGFTVPYAQEHTFGGFISRLEREQGSEALMPLGMFSSWSGAKIFGQSEVGLRVVSALWAAVAVLLLWRTGARTGFTWLAALLACHPFLWYYGGEVRPYAMVIAMGSGLLYGFVAILSSEGDTNRGLHALLLFGPLLCATHVLAVVPFAVVAGVVGIELLRRRWRPRPWDLLAFGISGGALTLLGLYYGRVISGGADINWEGPWKVGLGNLLFSGYELLGLMGFGPGRYELRQSAIERGMGGALQGLAHPATAGLVALALLYTLVLLRFWQRPRSERPPADRLVLMAGLVITTSVGVMFVLCRIVGSPFWGRHLASLLPFVVLAAGIAASAQDGAGQRPLNLLPLLLGVTLLISSLLVRFHPDHRRDDYRSAARLACIAVREGKTVWWAAARECAEYYGVVFCEAHPADQRACVVLTDNREKEELKGLQEPEVILISKPELYDSTRAVRNYADNHRFQVKHRLNAFEALEFP
jgi:4-amino-4-deoxy-L-arabinose transferase-like glycosyltransferase